MSWIIIFKDQTHPGNFATLVLGLLLILLSPPGFAEPRAASPRCDGYSSQRSPYFGDLHIHTSFSMDSVLFGASPVNDPRAAYLFAQGEPIGIAPFGAAGDPAYTARLDRPLDFAAVTDHAEFFGEVRICFTPDHPGYDSPECAVLRDSSDPAGGPTWFGPLFQPQPQRFDFCGPGEADCLEVASTIWQETQDAANEAQDPTPACEFTTFIGYEWTGSTGFANLHRNVLFRSSTVPELPVSYLDAPVADELFDALEEQCLEAGTGCDVLSIPHNSNGSLGRMFLPETSDGTPFDAASASRRVALEPLMEIIQHKGTSECRPGVGTNDELCDFELLRRPSLFLPPDPNLTFEPLSFARGALKEGLLEQERLGVNPFRLGFVGGTDTHSSTGGYTREDTFAGHFAEADSLPVVRLTALIDTNPGGLTVIWAEENSRDALFEAMQRREVYATSGTRPVVRFFGGFRYPKTMCETPAFTELGYSLGVPMGGEITAPGNSAWKRSPRFAVSALRDPGTAERPGTQLQRIQIVKGWVENGKARERVYDVAGSPDGGSPDGGDPDQGVDDETGEPIDPGFDSLCTVWEDPDFDPDQPAFYYARVLENPSWRWSTYQCRALAVDCDDPGNVPPPFANCCSPDIAKTIQERAWSSPIWYTPRPRTNVDRH